MKNFPTLKSKLYLPPDFPFSKRKDYAAKNLEEIAQGEFPPIWEIPIWKSERRYRLPPFPFFVEEMYVPYTLEELEQGKAFPVFQDYLDNEGVYQGPEVWEGSIGYSYPCFDIRRNYVPLTSLGGLREVRGSLSLRGVPRLKSLGGLREVGGSARITDCPLLEDLGELTTVGFNFSLNNLAKFRGLGQLEVIKKEFIYTNCPLPLDFGNLQKIEGGIQADPGFLLPKKTVFSKGVIYFTNPTIRQIWVEVAHYRIMCGKINEAPLTKLPLMLFDAEYIYRVIIEARLKGIYE